METQRRAHRAFAFQQRANLPTDSARPAGLSTPHGEPLADLAVVTLSQKRRQRFLEELTQHVLCEPCSRSPPR